MQPIAARQRRRSLPRTNTAWQCHEPFRGRCSDEKKSVVPGRTRFSNSVPCSRLSTDNRNRARARAMAGTVRAILPIGKINHPTVGAILPSQRRCFVFAVFPLRQASRVSHEARVFAAELPRQFPGPCVHRLPQGSIGLEQIPISSSNSAVITERGKVINQLPAPRQAGLIAHPRDGGPKRNPVRRGPPS